MFQFSFRYKNKENLRSHMKSIHVEGPKTCSICGRTSTNMKALAKHKKIHLEGSKGLIFWIFFFKIISIA